MARLVFRQAQEPGSKAEEPGSVGTEGLTWVSDLNTTSGRTSNFFEHLVRPPEFAGHCWAA